MKQILVAIVFMLSTCRVFGQAPTQHITIGASVVALTEARVALKATARESIQFFIHFSGRGIGKTNLAGSAYGCGSSNFKPCAGRRILAGRKALCERAVTALRFDG